MSVLHRASAPASGACGAGTLSQGGGDITKEAFAEAGGPEADTINHQDQEKQGQAFPDTVNEAGGDTINDEASNHGGPAPTPAANSIKEAFEAGQGGGAAHASGS